MRLHGRRGFTLVEAMISFAIIIYITLAVAVTFRVAMMAGVRASSARSFLSAVRKAYQGDGSTRGVLADLNYASSATAVGASTLALYGPGGVSNYSLSSTNLLKYTSSTTTLATGLSNLSFSYYGYSSTAGVFAAAMAVDAKLVTGSLQTVYGRTSGYSSTTTWYSGGSIKNHL